MRADHVAADDRTHMRREPGWRMPEKLVDCLVCFGFLFLFCLVDNSTAWESEKDFSADQKTSGRAVYRFEDWAGRTGTNYGRIVTNWIPDFGTTTVAHARQQGVTSVETNVTGAQIRRCYDLSPKAATNQNWTCYITEYPSVMDAHRLMLTRFLEINSPSFRPRPAEKEGIIVGDVCFIRSKPGDRGRVLYFCRNNVFVEVSVDGTNLAPCVEIARHLDTQVLKKSSAE